MPNKGRTEDMEVEDDKSRCSSMRKSNPRLETLKLTEIEDNEMTADALYRKLSEFSTGIPVKIIGKNVWSIPV